MTDIVNPILQWLYAHPNLAGLGTFLISAGESVAILGTIVPGSIMMTAIGALAGGGVIPLYPTILWAILGAIVGDGISYRIGYHFKDRLHDLWPFRYRPYLLLKGEAFFSTHGSMSVFIGRFVGPVRAIVPLVAGMLGMKPLKFYIANVLSAIGWAPAYMLPGILLGAASLELPPDIAVHAIFMIIMLTLFIILCLYLGYKLFILINNRINFHLSKTWGHLGRSKYFRPITTALKHYNPNKTYGQLTLAFYFLVISLFFGYLVLTVKAYGSENIFINNSVYYLFRSFRTSIGDQIMIGITFLGEKFVLLPLCLTLFVWLGYTKNWRTAWHILALGVLSGIGIEFFKHFVHSPRPWGIAHSPDGASFPSGHTTLATVFYTGIALLLVKAFNVRRSPLAYKLVAIIILAVGASRIYLGAHWFTDVLGGWLLGLAVLTLVILSYNRKAESHLHPKGIIVTIILTLGITYSSYFLIKFNHAKENYTRIDWPTFLISENNWWDQQGAHLPRYRINRFGLSDEILNLQWLGNLSTIQTTLLHHGWEIPPENNWINVIHRISDVKSAEHIPLVSPLFLDKKPSLIMIKHINDNKKLIILRLWDPDVILKDSSLPLWIGTVTVVPRTYSWLLPHKKQFELSPDLLFKQLPNQLEVKTISVRNVHKKEVSIVFIKPKS